MDGRIDQEIKIYTTPDELRAMADKAERIWPSLRAGDDCTFASMYLSYRPPIVAVSFLFDQDKMNAKT